MGVTLHARVPLDDCKAAFDRLERLDFRDTTWRIYWVACVALLRAVGHVLHKVDAKRGENYNKAIKSLWGRLHPNGPAIWTFIKNERDAVLKEYRFGAEAFVDVYAVVEDDVAQITDDETGELFIMDSLRYEGNGELSLQGVDTGDILFDAIKWWEEVLAELESEIDSA